jgi:CHRD domain-containing protein
MHKSVILGGSILAAVLVAGSCNDDDEDITDVDVKEVETFTATLSGANEVPPVTTTATGKATLSVVGGVLVYRVDVADITSPTLAHIHGPAAAGVNTGVRVNFCTGTPPAPPCATGSPFTGVLTAGVATQVTGMSFDSLLVLLRNGNAYVNVHTTANGGGEIRGQVARVP